MSARYGRSEHETCFSGILKWFPDKWNKKTLWQEGTRNVHSIPNTSTSSCILLSKPPVSATTVQAFWGTFVTSMAVTFPTKTQAQAKTAEEVGIHAGPLQAKRDQPLVLLDWERVCLGRSVPGVSGITVLPTNYCVPRQRVFFQARDVVSPCCSHLDL